MEVQFSKRAVKFLKKLDAQTTEKVRQKILQLHSILEADTAFLAPIRYSPSPEILTTQESQI